MGRGIADELVEDRDFDGYGDGYDTWNETLTIDFDDELAPITVTINVELSISWGEGDFDRDPVGRKLT